jgi:Spy/CpxP family protein refolding chaperone
MKTIGPSFSGEIQDAGLMGLPFSWGSDGDIQYGESITDNQRVAIEAVYDAHDSNKQIKQTPVPTLVEQILASPSDLAALKKALGL